MIYYSVRYSGIVQSVEQRTVNFSDSIFLYLDKPVYSSQFLDISEVCFGTVFDEHTLHIPYKFICVLHSRYTAYRFTPIFLHLLKSDF